MCEPMMAIGIRIMELMDRKNAAPPRPLPE
jgi:hypothetical protein